MYKKEKQDRRNIETTQKDQGQKIMEHQNSEDGVVDLQKLKRRVPMEKAASKKVKSSQPKPKVDRNLEEDPMTSILFRMKLKRVYK